MFRQNVIRKQMAVIVHQRAQYACKWGLAFVNVASRDMLGFDECEHFQKVSLTVLERLR